MTQLPIIDNKSILTPTSGFLGSGYTHSVNPYSGCGFSGSFCGLYCYAQHNGFITKGRPWNIYGVKQNIRVAYQKDYDRIKRPLRGLPKPLKIYCSSSTDPYCPQEKTALVTQSLLEEMVNRPPDVLVLQTRSPLVLRDIELISTIAEQANVWVSVTIETDMERIPGFPPHPSSPAKRIEALKQFRIAGIPAQATVSPLCPIANIPDFAGSLEEAADRVVFDHYLLGDGSVGGLRTKKTAFPQMIMDAGYEEWNTLEKFEEVVSECRTLIGPERVLVSVDGFNDI